MTAYYTAFATAVSVASLQLKTANIYWSFFKCKIDERSITISTDVADDVDDVYLVIII